MILGNVAEAITELAMSLRRTILFMCSILPRKHPRRDLAPLHVALLRAEPSGEGELGTQVRLAREVAFPEKVLELAFVLFVLCPFLLVASLLLFQAREGTFLRHVRIAEGLHQLLVSHASLGRRSVRPSEQRLAPRLRDGVHLTLRAPVARHNFVSHQPFALHTGERRVDAAVSDHEKVTRLPLHPSGEVVAAPGLADKTRQDHIIEARHLLHHPSQKSLELFGLSTLTYCNRQLTMLP